MNLKNLKWVKNVTPLDGELWAYSNFKVGHLFKLNWKKNKNNANKPQKSDVILLKQRGYVTHLVKVLDYESEFDVRQGDFSIYRIVETLWVINWTNLPASARANEVFGYDAVLHYEGGNVMELKTLRTFQKRWNSEDGFDYFLDHVSAILHLS